MPHKLAPWHGVIKCPGVRSNFLRFAPAHKITVGKRPHFCRTFYG